jgi:hypothetical protein
MMLTQQLPPPQQQQQTRLNFSSGWKVRSQETF